MGGNFLLQRYGKCDLHLILAFVTISNTERRTHRTIDRTSSNGTSLFAGICKVIQPMPVFAAPL